MEVPSADSSGHYDAVEVAEFLGLSNRPDYNILKACEELSELQEVLLKYHLKIPEKKPKMSAIIDELGDVAIRLMALVRQFNVEDEFGDRLDDKAKKFMEWYHDGKYRGGI